MCEKTTIPGRRGENTPIEEEKWRKGGVEKPLVEWERGPR